MWKKLKLKENTEIIALHAPADYIETIGTLPEGVTVKKKLSKKHDFIHLFIKNKAELDREFPEALKALNPGGMIWISYPKISSGMQTDLNRDKGWDTLEKLNLHWLSMISFDKNWTAFLLKNETQAAPSKASKEYHDNVAKFVDVKNRIVTVPDDLKKELNKNKKASAFYDLLPFSSKKEYVIWIVSAKQEATRTDRIRKTILKLSEGKKNPSEK